MSGVEKHTFKVVEAMQKKGMDFLLLSSCSVLLSEFGKRGWQAQRWWAGLEPTSKKTKILFFFSWPWVVIGFVGALIYFRQKGFNKLYCLTLTEKMLVTPIAKFLGYKVYWVEVLNPCRQLVDNVYGFLYKWWSNKAKIIVLSEYVKGELTKLGIDEDQVVVVNDGIDVARYKRQQDLFDVMVERKFWPVDQLRFNVGYIGRLSYEKGVHVLIKAIKLIKQEVPEVYLTIVGEGSERQKLEWLIDHYEVSKEVKLVGYKDDLLKWMWGFDVFVLPSLEESFGITALQAMACGRPVVATRAGGLVDIIEHEKDGFLVEKESSVDLARAIIRMYKDKDMASRLAAAGKEKVENEFALDRMVEKMFVVLNL